MVCLFVGYIFLIPYVIVISLFVIPGTTKLDTLTHTFFKERFSQEWSASM